ncbi:MAG: hypothetical protein WCA20_15545 [Candidatus Sulfotelmatobacter sp.]
MNAPAIASDVSTSRKGESHLIAFLGVHSVWMACHAQLSRKCNCSSLSLSSGPCTNVVASTRSQPALRKFFSARSILLDPHQPQTLFQHLDPQLGVR